MFIKNRFLQNIPELDTTSTADISFILLIFFLMTTSMTTEMGMRRQLPPMPAPQETPQTVKKENLMQIDIMANHVITCNEEATDKKTLAGRIADFARDKNHVISIRTAKDATYEDYFDIQQMLVNTAKQQRIKIRMSETEIPDSPPSTAEEGGTQ